MPGLITMEDLTNEEIISILDDAERLLPIACGERYLPLLRGRILGNLFFEPSTRTRMSFETAMKRLGGDVINLGDVKNSSVVKGETLYDTIQMIDGYSDIIAMRHPRQGAAQYAADACQVPILNGGDGAGHRARQDRVLAAVGVRHRLFPLSGPARVLLADLPDADAAGRGADRAHLRGRGQLRHAQQLFRADLSADRQRHGHVPVPAVLPDRAGRAGRGGAHRRRPADAVLLGHPAADEPDQRRGAVRDPVHLRLEPIPLALADHHGRELLHRRRRHQPHGERRRHGAGLEPGDERHHAEPAAARADRDRHAAPVRARAGGDGEMTPWPI